MTNTSKNNHNRPPIIMDIRQMNAKYIKAATPLRVAGVFVDLFSRVGQRPAPSAEKTNHIRLISISVSNYVEKVRWGLDLLEENSKSPIYFTEDFHAPAFAAFQTVPASKDQASQSPMIVFPDGNAIWGSDKILTEFFSNNDTIDLYPSGIKEETKELEKELDIRLGASARCFGYYTLFDPSKKYYASAAKFLTLHTPKVEQFLFTKMLDRGIAKAMIRAMNVDKVGEAAEEEVRKVFDEMSERLEKNGGGYLMDTPDKKYGFTAADLTLSSMAYFLIRPPEMATFHVPDSDLPPRFQQLVKDLRETTAGKHVLKVYSMHRPVDKLKREIVLKKVSQDRMPWMEMARVALVLGAATFGTMSLRRP